MGKQNNGDEELKRIVSNAVKAGETDENIGLMIKAYKSRPVSEVKKKEQTEPAGLPDAPIQDQPTAQATPNQIVTPSTDSESLSTSAPQLPLSGSPSQGSAISNETPSIENTSGLVGPDRSNFQDPGTLLSDAAKAKGINVNQKDATQMLVEGVGSGGLPIALDEAFASEEISKPYNDIMDNLKKDLFASGKSATQKEMISPEEVDYFLNKKADETFPDDFQKRSELYSMLQKGTYGRDAKRNKTEEAGVFFDNKELYNKKADLEVGLNTFKAQYGEGSEELLLTSYFAVNEGSEFNEDTKRKMSSETISINDAPSLSEQTLENIYNNKAYKASSPIPEDITFEEFKSRWTSGDIGYINPYGSQGPLNREADEMFAEALKANVQSTIDRHAQGKTTEGSVPTELLRIGKGGYEGVKEYVKKKDGNYGLSPAELSISKSYDELRGVGEDISKIEKNIQETKSWLEIKSKSEDPLSFEEQTKLKVNIKNYEQELKKLEGAYNNYDKAISDKKKDLLGVDSDLPEFENSNSLKTEQWNSDFKSLKKYYTSGYEGSLEDARVNASYEIDALGDAVLLRDDLSRYHNAVKKGQHIFNIDFFDSEDPLIRELTNSRVELIAINKVLSTKIDPKDRPRGYMGSFASGVAASVGMEDKVNSEQKMVREFVNVASENGIQITREQIKRAEESTGQKVAGAVGSTVLPMIQLAASTITLNTVGATGAVSAGFNALKSVNAIKNSRVAMSVVGFAETATQQAMTFELAGQGAATGVGEGLGSEAASMLIKNSPIGKLSSGLITGFIKRSAGATGQTLEEYAGEFIDELSKNEVGAAWANTLGEDPFEKLLITFTVARLLSVGSSGVESGKAMANIEEYILSKSPVTEEIKNAQRAIYESNDQKVPDNLKAKDEPKDIINPEDTLNVDKLEEAESKAEAATVPDSPKPRVVTDAEVEGMEITNPDGGFYSVEEVTNMVEESNPALSEITIKNPTPEVEALLNKKVEEETVVVPEPIVEAKTEGEAKPVTSEEVTVEPTEEGALAARQAYRAAIKDAVFSQNPDKAKVTEAITMMEEQGLDQNEVDGEIVQMLMDEGLSDTTARVMAEGYREMYSPTEKTQNETAGSKTVAKTEPTKESKNTEVKAEKTPIEKTKPSESVKAKPVKADSKGLETKSKGPEVESKEPKFKRTPGKSSQTMRFAGKIEDGTFKNEAEAIASYDVSTHDGVTQMADEVISSLGDVGAIKALSQPSSDPNNMIKKQAVLSKAGANLATKANKILKNPKSTPEQIEGAKEMRSQALNAINEASHIATKAGQAISYLGRLYKDHPAIFIAAKMKMMDAGSPLNQTNADGISLREGISNTQNEIKADLVSMIDENLSDKKLIEIITKATEMISDGSIKAKKDRVALGRSKVKAGLAAFKKKGTTLNSGLDADKVDAVAQIVAGYIQMGVGKASTIINKAYNAIKEVWSGNITKNHIEVIAETNPDYNALVEKNKRDKKVKRLEELEKQLKDAQEGREKLPKTKSKAVDAEIEALREEIKQEKVITPEALRNIAKMHLQGQIKEARSLAGAIVSRTNLNEAEAEAYASQIEEAIADKVKSLVDNKVRAFIKSTNKASRANLEAKFQSRTELTKEEAKDLKKLRDESLTKSEANRIAKLINQGALGNDAEFRAAFEKRFGFKEVPPKIRERINDVVSRINDLNEDSQRTIEVDGEVIQINTTFRDEINALNREFNTLLESTKPYASAKVFKEILSASYIMMLSGPMTFARAGTGGFSSAIIDSLAFIAFKPAHWGTFMKELVRATPAAWKRGIIARKTGIDYFGKNSMKGVVGEQGFDGSAAGSFESKMLRGLGKSIKNGNMGDATIKTVGQTLKVIHTLGALDAFANTLAGAAAGAVIKKKAMLKAGASKTDFRKMMDADYKAVAEQDFEMFKEDIGNEVDLRIRKGEIKKENRDREINSLMKERVGVTGNIRSAKSFYITNRTQEIKENQLGESLNSAITLAKEASLMGQPDGVMGMVADRFQKNLIISDKDTTSSAFAKLLGGMTFRFVRLTAQATNKSINSIPILGILPILIGKGWDPINEQYTQGYGLNKYKANPELAKLRITKNLVGSVLALALLAEMFDFGNDDDDAVTRMKNFLSGPSQWNLDPDRRIDIQSFGHRGMKGYSNNKKSNFGWENLSVSTTKDAKGNFVRDSYIGTRLNPEIAGIIASVGTFSDDAKGYNNTGDNQKARNTSRSALGYAPTFIGNNLRVATEGSFSSVGKMFKAFMAEEDAAAGLAAVGQEIITSNASILNPSAYAFATQEIQAHLNKGKSDSRGWHAAVRNMYGLDLMMSEDKKDVFGHTVPEVSAFDSYNPAEAHPKTIGLLYKFPGHGLNISKKSFSFLTPEKDLTGMKMDGEAWASTDASLEKEAQEYQEKLFDKWVKEDYESLESIDNKEDLESAMKKIQIDSYNEAKYYIRDKYAETSKLKLIEKKSSN